MKKYLKLGPYLALLAVLGLLLPADAFAQDPGADCNGAVNLDMSTTDQLNVTFDENTAGEFGGNSGYNVSPYTGGIDRDAWYEFTAPQSGTFTVEVSPTAGGGQDVAILIYNDPNCALTTTQPNNFVDVVGANLTESVEVSVASGTVVHVRLVAKVPFATAELDGSISIYRGSATINDLCQDARTVPVGTCGLPFNIGSRFFNNEGRPSAGGTFNTTSDRDGWITFTAEATGTVGVEYITSDADVDAALEVYTTASDCGNLVGVNSLIPTAPASSFVNLGDPAGEEIEVVEFNVTLGTTYYVRIMDLGTAGNMTGGLCLYDVAAEDDCATAQLINVPSCNVRFNVQDEPVSAAAPLPTGVPGTADDRWISFEADFTGFMRLEYNSFTPNAEPSVYIYEDAGAFNCGTFTNADIISFVPGSTSDNLSEIFPVTSGNTYFVRIFKEATLTPDVMLGTFCLYEDEAAAFPRYYLGREFATDGSNCGEQFNLIATSDFSTGTNSRLSGTVSCDVDGAIFEGWAFFRTPLPAEDLIIEYNNDNNDVRQANDVALELFEAPALTTLGAINQGYLTPGAGGFTINDHSEAAWNNIPIGETRHVELTFTADLASGEQFYVVFEGDGTHNLTFNNVPVFVSLDATVPFADRNITYAIFSVNPLFFTDITAGTTIEIAVENTSGALLSGQVKMFRGDNFQNIQGTTDFCANDLEEELEGAETLTLTTAQQTANTFYFVRVTDLSPPGSESNTIGSLCIRPDIDQIGDLCNNAVPMLVGDCDVNLSITSPFNLQQADLLPLDCDDDGTDDFTTADIQEDLWARFTANTNQTTVQYQPDGSSDIAMVVYRTSTGACGANLQKVGCGDVGGNGGRETLKINTIPGNIYFIQILSKTGNPSTVDGRICIFNTTERDDCADADLITLDVGDCNVLLDVPANFTNRGAAILDLPATNPFGNTFVNEGCDLNPVAVGGTLTTSGVAPDNENSRDAFVRFVGQGGDITITYQNIGAGNANTNPVLFVYTTSSSADPVDCGAGLNGSLNSINQVFCSNDAIPTGGSISGAAGPQTEVLQFTTVAGQQYILRIMDLADGTISPTGMSGILCISDGTQEYNTCAEARNMEIGECSVPVQIIGGLNDCSGTTSDANAYNSAVNALSVTCSSPTEVTLLSRAQAADANGWYYQDGDNVNDGTGAPAGWPNIPFGTISGTWDGPDNGPLGFNQGFLNTNINRNNANTTYYFARQFQVAGASTQYSSLKIRVQRDDGVIVYINGNEALRDNLPLSGVVHTTRANGIIVGSGESIYYEFEVNAADFLVAGANQNNVVAVELHNSRPNNGDLSMDVEIIGVVDQAATCDALTEADAWFTFTVPEPCNGGVPPCDPNETANGGICECNTGTVLSTEEDAGGNLLLPDDEITVQYDNRNNILEDAANVSMIVYYDAGNGCNTGNVATDLIPLACVDDLPAGVEGLEEFTITNQVMQDAIGADITAGQNFKVRVINNDPSITTSLGTACLLWGTTLAQETCPPSNDYGELNGDFKDFEVLGEFTNATDKPTNTIPETEGIYTGALDSLQYNVPCVVAGGSDPASNSPNPIRSQGWMQFSVPIGFSGENGGVNAVTVQYDNSGGNGNPQNAALAVYTSGKDSTSQQADGIGINCEAFLPGVAFDEENEEQPNEDGLLIVSCINSVFEGSEAVTFEIEEGRTYFVRVMNVSTGTGTPNDMPGRLRIFPFAPCDPGPDLVVNGDFENWPAISEVAPTTGTSYFEVFNDVHTIPFANADRVGFVENYLHFANDYGYVRDRTGSGGPLTAEYQQLDDNKSELNPEGLFTVHHTPWLLKRDWFCYGVGYSGYGGRTGGGDPTNSYCQAGGGGFESEACVPIELEAGVFTTGTFGTPTGGRPALLPTDANSNFMIANGIHPNQNVINAIGIPKLWCQTIDRGASESSNVGYYVFSVWVQNMISSPRNLDIPFLQLTVCDMEDPDTPGSFPASFGVTVPTSASINETSNLPGATFVAADNIARHNPPPGGNSNFTGYNFELAFDENNASPQNSYGAAMPCNTDTEPLNRRLKVLGSAFLVTERPDRWTLIRCIYKAPPGVRFLNACVENLSLNEIGNDLGIDDIQFRLCRNSLANSEEFEKLLKGDPCELANNPESIEFVGPLQVDLLDFTGNLLGDEVYLNWLVANESNLIQYEVQRSLDGEKFYTIGVEQARGSTDGFAEYNHVDREVPEGTNYIFYRLRMVNSNGEARLGPPIRIDINKLDHFNLKLIKNPVPAGNEVNIQFDAAPGQANLKLTSLMGVGYLNQNIDTQEGTNNHYLNTGGLTPGIYIVTIEQGGLKESARLVVF